ncbi:unnamed protein product [Blepharisma stoltei]|uniref:AB hydrolase-1 domain-containing protein n=1 Tax=Blepharisma stoltei TaxID=1481888 RepID=A0AAU9K7C3_9CILI|nr:unnamed protein product [Blepharisma stoltei]
MVNFFNFGSGKPVLWLHGLLGNALNLSSIAKGIDGNHFLLDARNHGRSFHQPGMTYKILSDDLFRFMDKHNIPRASVIGHSMGGKTAMYACCTRPERFEKVCILDVAPISYTFMMNQRFPELRQYLEYMKSLHLEGKSRKQIEKEIDDHFHDHHITALLSSNMKMEKEDHYIWRIGLDNLLQGLDDIAGWVNPDGRFTGEVLALSGGNSKHTIRNPLLTDKIKLIDFYTQIMPNTRIQSVVGAGHFLHAEKPKEVQNKIKEFLTGS